MKKRVLTLCLALVMSLGLAVPAAAAGGFTDVDANAYYAQAVDWAVDQKITSGTSPTTFSPDQTCTRAQIITFLWRAAGSPESSVTTDISDISSTDYFYHAVLWAKEHEMFEGTAFQPDAPCTRLMAVDFMWRAAGSPDAAGTGFSDADSPAVRWAVAQGVTAGTSDTTFSPNTACTRGQIVTFLYRASLPSAPAESAVDITKMTGTYVLEEKPIYEMVVTFYTPKLYISINNTLTKETLLTGNLTVSGKAAYTQDGVRITAYPDYLVLELSNEREHLQGTIGGKYILKSES